MKPQKSRFVITLASALLLAPAAFALDGKWNVAGNGSWNTPGNWLSGTTADGAGFTADFTGFSGNITLDGNRTIGNLIFSDATWYVTRTLSAGSGGSLTLVGTTPTITVNAMGFQNKITITTAILGTQGLTKDGVGPLELSGGAANTLTGAINVDAGTLTCKSGGDGFSSLKNMPQTITVASGGTLSYDQGFGGDKLVNNLQLSGPGISGSGALNLAGNATATGTITLNADATISHDYNSGTIAGSITGTDRNLELKTTASTQPGLTISGAISLGTGAITVKSATDGTHTSGVTLSGNNSYSGGTVLSTGTLNFGNAAALGSGPVTFSAGTTLQAGTSGTLANAVQIGVGITGTLDANGNSPTLSGPLTGDGNLTKIGNGVITLAGGAASDLAGAININAGRLHVQQGADGVLSLKNMPGTITVVSGAILSYDQGFVSGANGTLNNNLNLSGPGDGSYYGALNLAGNATATGTITLNADATISHDYNSGTIAGPITGTDRNLELKTSVNGQAGLTVSGPISLGTGGITVKGAANGGGFSVKLSGTNSYSGTTTVTAGTLALSGNGSIANTATINIAANATFDVSAVTGPSYANPSGRTLAFTIDKTGTTFKQGQLNIGAKNLTYGGPLTVTKSGTGALASGDTFTLVTTTGGTFGGWFSSVLLPALTTGLAWNTNGLATTGVLDIYNFTTTPLALSTPMNAAATLFAAKLANHASSSKQASPYPTGWNATATTPINGGSVVVNGNGSLTYTPDGLANVNGGTDSFTVTFNDGYGSQTMAVSVAVGTSPSGGQSPNVLTSGTDGSGNFYALFAGLPNTTYTVQTNSIASGSTWVKYGNYTTVGDGLINVTNVPPVAGSLFFRTVWPNY